MGYDLHFERRFGKISERRWRKAVSRIESLDMGPADSVVVNPNTGETIRIPHEPLDVVLTIDGKTEAVFMYRGGRPYFGSEFDFENPSDPVRVAAAELARELGAKIRGDEGEVYDW